MIHSGKPRVLILYSSPTDQIRLRVDKEHRAIDAVLREHGFPDHLVRRAHATTVADVRKALREDNFDIVQFSGHGSKEGIILEREDFEGSVVLEPTKLSAVIRDALPDLQAMLLLSCYSAEAIPALIEIAPFLVTVHGEADDDGAIEFISTFYSEFFRFNSIESAFSAGLNQLVLLGKAEDTKPILSRRASVRNGFLIQAFVDVRADSILIDLSDVEGDLAYLPFPREDFLSILLRKMRLHGWIFRYPRENAVISMGLIFGLFSWQNARDVVRCHRLMRLRADVDEKACASWVSLLVAYNDLYSHRYRTLPEPAAPENSTVLDKALRSTRYIADVFLTGTRAEHLRQYAPEQFRVTFVNTYASLDNGEFGFVRSDYAAVIRHLEESLSAIHDLVSALAQRLTQSLQAGDDKAVKLDQQTS